jgi:hypothetical protein
MIQSYVPNLHKSLWKLKAPLKVKVFCGTYVEQLFWPHTIQLNATIKEAKQAPFVTKMRQLGTCFLNAELQEQFGTQLIWLSD